MGEVFYSTSAVIIDYLRSLYHIMTKNEFEYFMRQFILNIIAEEPLDFSIFIAKLSIDRSKPEISLAQTAVIVFKS